ASTHLQKAIRAVVFASAPDSAPWMPVSLPIESRNQTSIRSREESRMPVRVAINGFGRIGRLVFRAMVEQGLVGKDIQLVAAGDIVPADNLAYLLKYHCTQGRVTGTVASKKSAPDKAEDDVLIVNGMDIQVVSAK